MIGSGLVAASGLVIYYFIVSNDYSATTADVRVRSDLFSGHTEELDINDSSRVDLFWMGVEGIKSAPLTGYGTFSSAGFLFRPHNQFLAVWLDNGLIGILLFLSALALLGWECYCARNLLLWVAYIGLLSTTPFSQNLLEDYSFLPEWVACAAGAMAARKKLAEGHETINPEPALAN